MLSFYKFKLKKKYGRKGRARHSYIPSGKLRGSCDYFYCFLLVAWTSHSRRPCIYSLQNCDPFSLNHDRRISSLHHLCCESMTNCGTAINTPTWSPYLKINEKRISFHSCFSAGEGHGVEGREIIGVGCLARATFG